MAKKYIGVWQTLNIIDRMLKKENKEYGITAVSFALERIKSYIQKLPAADVQEVKHGFWEEGKVRGQFALICSKCKCDAGVTYDYDYCPNCGAKMDGKDDKNECKTI